MGLVRSTASPSAASAAAGPGAAPTASPTTSPIASPIASPAGPVPVPAPLCLGSCKRVIVRSVVDVRHDLLVLVGSRRPVLVDVRRRLPVRVAPPRFYRVSADPREDGQDCSSITTTRPAPIGPRHARLRRCSRCSLRRKHVRVGQLRLGQLALSAPRRARGRVIDRSACAPAVRACVAQAVAIAGRCCSPSPRRCRPGRPR